MVDKDQAAKIKAEIQLAAMAMDHKEFIEDLKERASIIKTEYEHGNWLTKSWRPITMLVFTACIVSHWLGYTPENLSPDQIKDVMFVIKLGLGGYVGGRTVEKVVKEIKKNK